MVSRTRARQFRLSTHDLTRRSTVFFASAFCTATFQLTTSHGGRPSPGSPAPSYLFPFNSRPHTEVDSFSCIACLNCMPFNSRPHTEVDDPLMPKVRLHSTFQLTTSHGGRPDAILFSIRHINLSTHDLTRRSTPRSIRHSCACGSFNSRPHTEVDLL